MPELVPQYHYWAVRCCARSACRPLLRLLLFVKHMPAPSSNTRRFGLQTLNPPCALWTNPHRGRGRAGSWGCLAGASGDMLCMAQRGACPRPRIQNFNVWRPPPWIYFTAFACAVHVADHASVLGIRVGPLRDAAARRCSLLMGGGAGGERGGGILQHITFVCASKLVRNFRDARRLRRW